MWIKRKTRRRRGAEGEEEEISNMAGI